MPHGHELASLQYPTLETNLGKFCQFLVLLAKVSLAYQGFSRYPWPYEILGINWFSKITKTFLLFLILEKRNTSKILLERSCKVEIYILSWPKNVPYFSGFFSQKWSNLFPPILPIWLKLLRSITPVKINCGGLMIKTQ